MPSNWTALKCEECNNPLEPLAGEGLPRLIRIDSSEAAKQMIEALHDAESGPHERGVLIVGGNGEMEMIRSPFADLLKCTSCGLLYERKSNGD